jgi:hypothetical protein
MVEKVVSRFGAALQLLNTSSLDQVAKEAVAEFLPTLRYESQKEASG